MSKKKQITKPDTDLVWYYPYSEGEQHLPEHNFVGAGTRLYDRLGLNYDGKVGTNYFWLPKDRIDLSAVKHDLAYFNPDNIARLIHDAEFIRPFKRKPDVLADPAITLQLLARSLYGVIDYSRSTASNYLGISGLASLAKTLTGRKFLKNKPSILGYVFNVKSGVAPPFLKKVAKDYLGITGTIRGPRGKGFYKLLGLKLLGLVDTLLIRQKDIGIPIYDELARGTKTLSQYAGQQKELNKVMDKYEKYLNSVGEFDENGDFVVTKEGNPELYKQFFSEFQNYINYVNDKLITRTKDIYPIPQLNEDNILLTKDIKYIEPVIKPSLNQNLKKADIAERETEGLEDITDITDSPELKKNISEYINTMSKTPSPTPEPWVTSSPRPITSTPSLTSTPTQSPTPSATSTPRPTQSPEQKFTPTLENIYKGFLQGNQKYYEDLINYIDGGTFEQNKKLADIINITHKPYTGSPLYVRKRNEVGKREKIRENLKRAIHTVAFIRDLNNVDETAKQDAGDFYATYLKSTDDPTQKKNPSTAKFEHITQLKKVFRNNKLVDPSGDRADNYNKAVNVINSRYKHLGMPEKMYSGGPEVGQLRNYILSNRDVVFKFPDAYPQISERLKNIKTLSPAGAPETGGEGVKTQSPAGAPETPETPKTPETVGLPPEVTLTGVEEPAEGFTDLITGGETTKDFIEEVKKLPPHISTPLITAVKNKDIETIINTIKAFSEPDLRLFLNIVPEEALTDVYKALDIEMLPFGPQPTPPQPTIPLPTQPTGAGTGAGAPPTKPAGFPPRPQARPPTTPAGFPPRPPQRPPLDAAVTRTIEPSSSRIGNLGPHMTNITQQLYDSVLKETQQQSNRDYNNWLTFDLPTDNNGGLGTVKNNPLIRQNEMNKKFSMMGNIYDDMIEPPLPFPFGDNKNFYKFHNKISRKDVEEGIKKEKLNDEELLFLEQFNNTNNNDFMSQDQTTAERNDFKNIYTGPSDSYFKDTVGHKYKLQNVVNKSILRSDFYDNLNYFVNP